MKVCGAYPLGGSSIPVSCAEPVAGPHAGGPARDDPFTTTRNPRVIPLPVGVTMNGTRAVSLKRVPTVSRDLERGEPVSTSGL